MNDGLPDSIEAVRALGEHAATYPEALRILHQIIRARESISEPVSIAAFNALPLPLSPECVALL
ncbi:MAG: hypothetical protein AAF125_18920, partial [Chloroflexota bacterium]